MSIRLIMIGALVACGSKSAPETDADAIEYERDLDLATEPTAWVGLPMTGVVHFEVHLQHAKADLSKATGTLRVTCPKGCQVGDDHAKLVPRSRHASVFAGQGLSFGHIRFDSFEVGVAIEQGTATITKWNVVSDDIQLVASGRVKLGRTLEDSVVDLCLRFGATPALQQRSLQTAAVIDLTGAPRSAKDGLFNIQLADRFDHLRTLARVCDGSAPPVADEPLARPTLAAPPPAAPDPKLDADTAALISSAVKRTSDTTYDIDNKKWLRLMENPMAVAKGARVIPAIKNGKPVGFKLSGVPPESLFAHLGLVSGDVITTIEGEPLTSIDKALDLYTRVRDTKAGDSVKITLERNGVATTLVYTMR